LSGWGVGAHSALATCTRNLVETSDLEKLLMVLLRHKTLKVTSTFTHYFKTGISSGIMA
jgi:hypothetical protein